MRRRRQASAGLAISLRRVGDNQGLASCTVNEMTIALSTPIGCGNHHTMPTMPATAAHQASDHRLTRDERVHSACFHQRTSTNKNAKYAAYMGNGICTEPL